eukprot:4671113-Heterocapsa_arctica.AAC.1
MGVQSKARYSAGVSYPCLPRVPSWPVATVGGDAAVPPAAGTLTGGPVLAVGPASRPTGGMIPAPVLGGCLWEAASLAAALRSWLILWPI